MYSRIIKLAIIFILVPALFGVSFGYALVNYLEIPDVKQLESYRPKSATRLYADDGTLYAELFVEKRVPIPITEMPRHLKLAFVAIEDVRFYRHFGIDARGIVRALYKDIHQEGQDRRSIDDYPATWPATSISHHRKPSSERSKKRYWQSRSNVPIRKKRYSICISTSSIWERGRTG